VIIDFHTHIFPPEVRKNREDYVLRDRAFAEMYATPRAKVARAEDLAASMEAAGVDVSVALGFAWGDHADVVRHNDYLLETAIRGEGRIIAFCTINMLAPEAEREFERVAAAGARGLGELRPESQGWDLNGAAGERLAKLAAQHGLALLFHVTEPAGHHYPGKYGLSLASFVRFASAHNACAMIGAHLGGRTPVVRGESAPRRGARGDGHGSPWVPLHARRVPAGAHPRPRNGPVWKRLPVAVPEEGDRRDPR
jgi:predicted TIM-barrel fold metal-dependent hydrolase